MHKINNIIKNQNPEFLPKLAEWHVYGNEQQGRFLTKYPEELNPTYYGTEVTDDIKDNKFKRQLGKKSYELKDHLGNVRVTHSDIKMPTGTPAQPFRVDLLSKSEYYPYGMVINDLSYNATGTSARYGYNGTHEQDKELNGDGNYLDFGNFGYDTRVAMRRNQEPLSAKYPHLSGYAIFGDNPIMYVDIDGNEKHVVFYWSVSKQSDGKMKIVEHPTKAWTASKDRPIYDDKKYPSGLGTNVDWFEYQGKTYSAKTHLPGEAGKYFKREEEFTRNLVVTAVVGIPLLLVTAPALSTGIVVWSALSVGYEMYSSIKNLNENSTLKKDYLSPSLLGEIGKRDAKALNKQYGTNFDPKDGETAGNVLDIINSGRALFKNTKNINKIYNAAQIPNDINSTVNATINTSNSVGSSITPNEDEGD
jgi:hypothetical protein